MSAHDLLDQALAESRSTFKGSNGSSSTESSQSIVDELFKDFISSKISIGSSSKSKSVKVKVKSTPSKTSSKPSSVDEISKLLDMEINSIRAQTKEPQLQKDKESSSSPPSTSLSSVKQSKPSESFKNNLVSQIPADTVPLPPPNIPANIPLPLPPKVPPTTKSTNTVSHLESEDTAATKLKSNSSSASASLSHLSLPPPAVVSSHHSSSSFSVSTTNSNTGTDATTTSTFSNSKPLAGLPVINKLNIPKQLGCKLSQESLSLIKSKDKIDRNGRVWEDGEVNSSHSEDSNKDDSDSDDDIGPSDTGSINSDNDWKSQNPSKHKKKHKHKHKKKKKKKSNREKDTKEKSEREDKNDVKDKKSSRKDKEESSSTSSIKDHDKEREKMSNDESSSAKGKEKGDEDESSKSIDDKDKDGKKREKDKKRKRNRSRSRTPKKSKRSRSRSKSPRRSRKSPSPRRNRYGEWDARRYSDKRSRSRSRSPNKRRKSSERKRDRSSDRKRERSFERKRERSPERKRERSPERKRERSPERKRERSKEESAKDLRLQIDKAKLRKIAIANTLNTMKAGQPLPGPVDLTVSKAGGKSVEELTDFCKRISEKDKEKQDNGISDSSEEEPMVPSDDEDALIHHPFKMKDTSTSIVMNIRNAKQLPVLTPSEKVAQQATLRLAFPVSSGSHHRASESEWVPVEKTTAPVTASTNSIVTAQAATSSKPEPEPAKSIFPTASKNVDIGAIISERLQAVRKLQENPYDVQALTKMHKVQEKASQWAQSKHLPGQFTGSTGAHVMSQQEILGDKRKQAWVKKTQFSSATPVHGIGMFLLQKMGWKQGEGLGKHQSGSTEPLQLDIKIDRKGLSTAADNPRARQHQTQAPKTPMPRDLSHKHPVSALMELCNKRRWGPPSFNVVGEEGPAHKKCFLFKVNVNNVEYQPAVPSSNKKSAKAQCAAVCLQELGLLSKDAPMNY